MTEEHRNEDQHERDDDERDLGNTLFRAKITMQREAADDGENRNDAYDRERTFARRRLSRDIYAPRDDHRTWNRCEPNVTPCFAARLHDA